MNKYIQYIKEPSPKHYINCQGSKKMFDLFKVQLSWREVIGNNHHASRELVREVLEQPKLRFVPHVGYVSLFPFVGRIIPPVSCMISLQCNLLIIICLLSVLVYYILTMKPFILISAAPFLYHFYFHLVMTSIRIC